MMEAEKCKKLVVDPCLCLGLKEAGFPQGRCLFYWRKMIGYEIDLMPFFAEGYALDMDLDGADVFSAPTFNELSMVLPSFVAWKTKDDYAVSIETVGGKFQNRAVKIQDAMAKMVICVLKNGLKITTLEA